MTALLGVLGIVYGDIGTSPLYAIKASLERFKAGGLARGDVLGVLSLIFWSLILIVTLKYILLVMRADNRGEGGILALMTLAQREAKGPRARGFLSIVGICGACLFFGDGTITPAISVLSAIEGLEIAAPQFKDYVLPLSLVVIVALFLVQYRGTASIGKLFGPVMTLWFAVIGALGLIEIINHPSVLLAILPIYGFQVLVQHGFLAFLVLGSVVLCVTGAEALYADMGHFGRRPIRLAWLFFVLPSLLLNYFGQGALVLSDPATLSNPFFLLGPEWLRLPMVLLATAATVIASQAMISGAYSMARQCTQMGFLPRLTVLHTSATEEGQIYLPQVNAALLIGVLILVFTFRTSDSLASAYGIAVTGTFTCTSILGMLVFRRRYNWSRFAAFGAFGFFFAVDFTYFTSNGLKIPEGGWVPLAFGLSLLTVMLNWKRGRTLLFERWQTDSMPLSSFLARLPQSRTHRVPGIAVFMTGDSERVPSALLHNLKHNKVLHERVLFLTVQNIDVPEVRAGERAEVSELAPGIHRVLIRYGFMESPNIPRELASLQAQGLTIDPMQASYFLGRETLVGAKASKLPKWRMWLFLYMSRNSVSATEFFRIPSDRVVELGVRVAI
ncbi:MAG: potassium transporter Kup [Alphaproteobacteria bacterium]|nr:potassium transporter Kup [Alphaproteobacteria bacterium]